MRRTLTRARADHLRKTSNNFLQTAEWVEKQGSLLDDGGTECECCGSFRYRSFPQHLLKQKVLGAAERLRELANTFAKRADDPEFEDHREEQEA